MEEKFEIKKVIKDAEKDFEKVIASFKEELVKIRVTRVSPSFLENIFVEIFGKKFPLKQLGTISISGPREIQIQVWDGSYLNPIFKTLKEMNLGSVSISENKIKISFPEITEEFRENLLKLISQKKENAKRKIREIREKILREIEKNFREKKISEDQKFKGKKELQKLVEDFNEKIEEIFEKKKSEIE